MPGHRSQTLLAFSLSIAVLSTSDPTAAQVRYVSEEAVGIGVLGEYGTHLGPQMISAQLLVCPRGPFILAFTGGAGTIETVPISSGFAGEDPRETYYGPRLGVRLSRRGSERALQVWAIGGWEGQEITHPEITAAEGELKTNGPVLGVMLQQLMDRTDARDIWFDGSLERYNLTVHIKNGDNYMDIWDPTITYQAGLTFAFKGGRTRPRSTLVRAFARVTEWDLSFGISVGLMWEAASVF